MYFPPLQPLHNSQYNVSGDVTIDPSAAIAPGVLLQATPDSRIIIAAGVCIGMGTIVHAIEGTVAVDSGASLGAAVLVLGKSKIGANACVGSMTTIINSDIERGQVVAPGSLLGDDSRKPSQDSPSQDFQSQDFQSQDSPSQDSPSQDSPYVVATATRYTVISGAIAEPAANQESASSSAEAPSVAPSSDPIVNTPAVQASINSAVARNASANSPSMSPGRSIPQSGAAPTPADNNSTGDTPSAGEAEQQPESESGKENPAIVYGQEQLDELMGTLFPHQKSRRKP